MDCPYCGTEMSSLGIQKLQLGQASAWSGIWNHLIAGALETEIFQCPSCGKLEFFAVRPQELPQEDVVQIPCPACGAMHDFDDARCPACGKRLL